MSVTMKLDAPSVRALIADNDEFRLELQSAVIQEIVRGVYDKSIPAQVMDMIGKQFAQSKSDLMQAVAVDTVFRNHIDSALQKVVESTRIQANAYSTSRTLSLEAKAKIDTRVRELLDEEVKVEGLQTKIDAALERMERKAEKAIEKALERIDATYHEAVVQKVMEKFVSFATK